MNPEPLHIISLGAGVQSSTMALMASSGEITPMPYCAIFADTQAEPKAVYEWLDWLEPRLSFPVHRVTAGNLTELSLKRRVNKTTGTPYYSTYIPAFVKSGNGKGMLRRKCTWDFKMTPIVRRAKKLARAAFNRTAPLPWVIQWIGISKDEIMRIKPSREKIIEHRWPLVEKEMTRRDCLKWMNRMGFPEPPKSSCIQCPYHSDEYWSKMKRDTPDEFDQAVKYDYAFREACKQGGAKNEAFLHSSLVPLDKVEFNKTDPQLNLFQNECEGMCGV